MATDTAAAVARIQEFAELIRRGTAEAQGNTAFAAGQAWVPVEFGDAIRTAFADYAATVRWLLTRVDELVAGAPVVDVLDAAADQWSPMGTRLAAAGDELAGLVTGLAESWEGRGGAGYADVIGPQVEAVALAGQVAGGAARATVVLAGAGRTLYLALAVALGGFAAAVNRLPRGMASAQSAPAALAVAAGAASSLVDYVGRCAQALDRQVSAAAAAVTALTGSATDPAVYPGGGWPSPTTGPTGPTIAGSP